MEKQLSWQRNGKRVITFLVMLLAALALAITAAPCMARADDAADATESEDTTVDPFDYLPLDVVASTDDLPDNQVQITVTDTNKLDTDLSEHSVSFKVPDGWSLVSGSTSSKTVATKDGESVSTTAVLAKGSSDGSQDKQDDKKSDADNSGKSKDKMPSTGDNSVAIAIIAVIAIAGVVALHAGKKLHFKATLSIVLIGILVLNMFPAGALQAMAEEVNGTTNSSQTTSDDAQDASDSASSFSFSKTVEVEARGEKLSIEATVTCKASSEGASSIVNLEMSRPIHVGANTVNVTVLSEVAYAGSSEKAGDLRSYDTSKIMLSGSLEGATVREGAYTVKVEGKNEDDTDLINRTHYELRFIIDNIPDGAASEDSDYGYIELNNQPFADESHGYGIACVSYSDPTGSIVDITSEAPMDGDVNKHTFDNGYYWDGNNRFRVPVDMGGVDVGLPIPATSEFAKYATGDTFTIDGVKYCTFTNDDIVKSIQVNGNSNIDVTECTRDLDYTWVTLEVKDATGYAAYEELTDALTHGGILFGGEITSTYANTIVYPEDAVSDSTGTKGDAFAYAETSPVAFAWAVQLERGDKNTVVTYFASAHSSQEADDEAEVGDVVLANNTTFSVNRIQTDKDGNSTEAKASDIKASVYDAKKNLIKLEVSVPNDQFDSDVKLRGLSTSDKEKLFDAMYMYVSGVNLSMTNGSINAFGVPEKDADVELFEGESFNRAEAAGNSSSETDDDTEAVTLSDNGIAANGSTVFADITSPISRYESLAVAGDTVTTNAGDSVKQMDNIYRNSSNSSKSDAKVKSVLSDAVSTGLGINHAINLVTVLGKGFLNYATAGFTIVGLLGAFAMDFLPQETQQYTVDDVMNKLDEMDTKLDCVETTVKTINVKFDQQSAKTEWNQKANTYTNLMSLLCSQTTSDIFTGMDRVLGEYNEIDDNGAETTKKCSRSTTISHMPEKAIEALKTYLDAVDSNAKNKGFDNGIGSAYTALRSVVVSTSDIDNENIFDVYFKYVDTKYNWDVETKAAKRAFLASFMVMYNNAYALYSAKLSVQLYEAKKEDAAKGGDAATQGVLVNMQELQNYANEVSEVLYGKVDWDQLRKDYPGKEGTSSKDPTIKATDIDTEKLLADNPGKTFDEVVQEKYLTNSAYVVASTDTEVEQIKFLATDSSRSRSYKVGSYALTAAYDESCFAKAFISVHINDANNSWKPSNTFEIDELRTMVERLNALPAAMRPTITDSDGTTRPVENIAEEMEAIGFKSQHPNTQFKKQLLNINTATMRTREEKIIGNKNASLWEKNDVTTRVWATVLASDKNPTDEVDRYSDEARNWNYFFTDFEYNIYDFKGNRWREQFSLNLSSDGQRLISSVDIGNKIADPENYIVLSAEDSKAVVTKWDGDGYSKNWTALVAARYGKVFNLKTGETIDNQLLYAIEGEMPISAKFRCEYYPFGQLLISDNGKDALMSSYKDWYQTNWYADAITDGSNYNGSQNNYLDIRIKNLPTD